MFVSSHQTIHTSGGTHDAAPRAEWTKTGGDVHLTLAKADATTVALYGPWGEVRDLLSAAVAAMDEMPLPDAERETVPS